MVKVMHKLEENFIQNMEEKNSLSNVTNEKIVKKSVETLAQQKMKKQNLSSMNNQKRQFVIVDSY